MSPLVKRLLERGLISRDVLPGLDSLRADLGGTTPLNILRAGLVDEDRMLDFICDEFDIPAVLQFEIEDVPHSIIDIIPQRVVEVHRTIPIAISGDILEVVMSDPTDKNTLKALNAACGMTIEPRASAESVISWALLKFYEIITPSLDEALAQSKITDSIERGDVFVDEDGLQDEPVPLTAILADLESAHEPASAIEDVEIDLEVDVDVEEPEVEPSKERISFPVMESDDEHDGGPEMGNWEAPFELARTVGEPSYPPPEPRSPKPTRRDLPRDEPPAPEPSEALAKPDEMEDGALLLIDEEDWEDAGAGLEEQIEADAVSSDQAIIVDQKVAFAPIRVMKNVMLGNGHDTEIIPPQPMTKRKAVDAIKSPGAGRPAVKTGPREEPRELPVSVPADVQEKKQPAKLGALTRSRPSLGGGQKPLASLAPPSKRNVGRLKPGVVESWKQDLEILDTRDAVLESTLRFIDEAFGPAIFLARKDKGLGGWNCSTSFGGGISGDVHSIVVTPPAPREIWHAIERKRGMMGPISAFEEYPFLSGLTSGGSTSILVIPVVIRGIAAGVFLCVLRETWAATPALRDTLESMGVILSEKLEEILRNRKQSQGK